MSSPRSIASDRRLPSRGDRASILAFIGAGIVIAVAVVVFAVTRVVELLTQDAVTVLAEFRGELVPVIGCLIAVSLGVLRGQVFSRRNTRFVAVAAGAGILGAAAEPFFRNMGTSGAFSAISNGDFDNVVMTVEPFPFILGAFVVAIIGSAFSIGERLQRDTEGLV